MATVNVIREKPVPVKLEVTEVVVVLTRDEALTLKAILGHYSSDLIDKAVALFDPEINFKPARILSYNIYNGLKKVD
jgi:hypothetical protein